MSKHVAIVGSTRPPGEPGHRTSFWVSWGIIKVFMKLRSNFLETLNRCWTEHQSLSLFWWVWWYQMIPEPPGWDSEPTHQSWGLWPSFKLDQLIIIITDNRGSGSFWFWKYFYIFGSESFPSAEPQHRPIFYRTGHLFCVCLLLLTECVLWGMKPSSCGPYLIPGYILDPAADSRFKEARGLQFSRQSMIHLKEWITSFTFRHHDANIMLD